MSPHVLLVSHSGEPLNTAAVAAALQRRGAAVTRLDTDRVPTTVALTVDAHGPPRLDGRPLEVDAAWFWRAWSPTLPDAMPEPARRAVAREQHTLIEGLVDALGPARLLDSPHAVAAASGKLRQLRLAEASGLHVAPTLHTCDPAAARAFFEAQDRDVIVKLHEQPVYGLQAHGGFPTRRLTEADLPALDALRYGPMIVQRRVEKAWELRIAWVDGRAFTGALEGAACGDDWRYSAGEATWTPWTLDATVHAAIARLMSRLGLRQGAVDLIVQPDGTHTFLEVNPVGEWGMLADRLGLPIPDALADALLDSP